MSIGAGFSISSFSADMVIVGEHFERPEDVGFERLIVEFCDVGGRLEEIFA